MGAVTGVLGKVGGVFGAVGGVFGGVFGVLGETLDLLGRYGAYLFIAGFFGVLMAFLWFFFRYLDRKRLALPTVLFTFFLVVLLGGGAMMLQHGVPEPEEDAESAAQSIAAEKTAPEGGGVRL